MELFCAAGRALGIYFSKHKPKKSPYRAVLLAPETGIPQAGYAPIPQMPS